MRELERRERDGRMRRNGFKIEGSACRYTPSEALYGTAEHSTDLDYSVQVQTEMVARDLSDRWPGCNVRIFGMVRFLPLPCIRRLLRSHRGGV